MDNNWQQPQDWSKDGSVISGVTGLKTGAWTSLFNAHETVNGKDTEIILKLFTVPAAAEGNERKITAERERFLVSARLQQSLVKDGAKGWVNVFKISEEPPSFTMPKCGPSLEDMLDHKVTLAAPDLYTVLHCVLDALIELKTRHDRSHGDVKASNVLASLPGESPPYKLADPTPKGEAHSANDLYNLGTLMYRLIEYKNYDPLAQFTPSKNWTRLGPRRDRWIEFLHLLLSPNGCQDSLADVKKEALRLKPSSPMRPVYIAVGGVLLLAVAALGFHLLASRLYRTTIVQIQPTTGTSIDPATKAAYDQARQTYQDARTRWTATPRNPRYDHTKSIDLARESRTLIDEVSLTDTAAYQKATQLYTDAAAKLDAASAQAAAEELAGKSGDQNSLTNFQAAQKHYAETLAQWTDAAAKFAPGEDHSHSKELADSGLVTIQDSAKLLEPSADPAARRLAAEEYKDGAAKLTQALAALPAEQSTVAAHQKARAIYKLARDEYHRSKDAWDKVAAEDKNLDLRAAQHLADEAVQDLPDPLELTDDAALRAAADRTYAAAQKLEQAVVLAARAKPLQQEPVVTTLPVAATQVAQTKGVGGLTASTAQGLTTVLTNPANALEIAAAVQKADAALKLKSYVEALALYKKAADLGSVGAMSNVGLLYETGTGTPRDYTQAAAWYKKAADHDYVPAIVNLASLYQKGKGVDQNFTQALHLYKRAAESGNTDAMISLGSFYETGEGTERNFAEALTWYKKAAEKQNPIAITNVGVFYEKGQGVARDFKAAADWYAKAAALDYPPAMNDLAVLYDSGKYDNGKDVRPDYAAALKWYKKAADLDYAPAMCNLGALYDNGQGVPLDHAEALKWFLKAAQRNHGMAMYDLGVLYDSGRGTPPNSAQAISWYRRAAHSDDPAAQRLATDALNRLGFTP